MVCAFFLVHVKRFFSGKYLEVKLPLSWNVCTNVHIPHQFMKVTKFIVFNVCFMFYCMDSSIVFYWWNFWLFPIVLYIYIYICLFKTQSFHENTSAFIFDHLYDYSLGWIPRSEILGIKKHMYFKFSSVQVSWVFFLISCNPIFLLAVPEFHLSVFFLEHSPVINCSIKRGLQKWSLHFSGQAWMSWVERWGLGMPWT